MMSAREDVAARTVFNAESVCRTIEAEDEDARAHPSSAGAVLEAADRETINIGCA
jgi:hypothetical protein